MVILFIFVLRLVFTQEQLSAFPRNRFGGTSGNTSSTMDTFVIANLFDIHFTNGNAKPAIGAFVLIELYPKQCNSTEKTVQRAKRTKKPTEETEEKDTSYDN